MRNPKRKDLEIKRIGTLSVPFTQSKFAQLLLWLKYKDKTDEDCPLDLSVLPEAPPSPGKLADGDVFFVFREIRIEENDDRNEIVFDYDRMRVESGGVVKVPSETERTSRDVHDFIHVVAEEIYNEHQVVLSEDLLRNLQAENPALRETNSAPEFLDVLKELGLFSPSMSYAEHLNTELHIGDTDKSE